MKLLKSGSSLGVSTLVKVLLGALGVKVIVYFIGTAGFGKLGQFMSFMFIMNTVAGGGISNGIISKISTYHDNQENKNGYITAGFWIGFFFSLFLMSVCFLFSKTISNLLFKTEEYFYVILLIGLFQYLNIFTIVIGGYLNGMQKNILFSKIQIISSIFGTFGLLGLVYCWDLVGAMFGLVWFAVSPGIIMLVFYLTTLRKQTYINKLGFVQKAKVKELLKYSFMMLVSSLLLPATQIFIRDFIYKNYGWSDVGIWQAASKLSEAGLMFLNVVMVNFYLPELGRTSDKVELKKIITKAYQILVPILLLYIGIVYLFRDLLIKIFYNEIFLEASDLLLSQAIGDAFKVLSLVFGFFIVLKAKIKLYVFFEVLLFVLLISLSYFLIPVYGMIGANYAHIITYLIVFSIGLLFWKKTI